MNEGRLETVKEDLRKLEHGDYYDTHDYANALSESVGLASELVEVVERAARLLGRKRENMNLFAPAIAEAKENREHMLVAKFEIEKFKLQAEIDLLEYVVNG